MASSGKRSFDGRPRPAAAALLLLCAALLLAGCGGGGGGGGGGGSGAAGACSDGPRKAWLRSYFDDWYFWAELSPKPAADGPESLDEFFAALGYTGSDARFPADRWSYRSSTEQFTRFFNDGQTLGYGLNVAGKEVVGRPDAPLYVSYVDPGSPADVAGLQRGDQLLSVNGTPAAAMIANSDFSALSASAVGDRISVTVQRGPLALGERTLSAAVYTLAPVVGEAVLSSAGGRRVGYLMVKDMVTQAEAPYAAAIGRFLAAGIDDLVIDLRYNGGGFVTTSGVLASYVSRAQTAGRVYASFSFNAAHSSSNQSFGFPAPARAAQLPRVYVLAGPRTCSASELLVNGLKPFVEVVTVGATTCGKPVGFQPQADTCGSSWSVVNFESTNANGVGRYWDGLAPTCAVAEDFTRPLGNVAEPLLGAALAHADSGQCPVSAGAGVQPQALRRERQARDVNDSPAWRGGMLLP